MSVGGEDFPTTAQTGVRAVLSLLVHGRSGRRLDRRPNESNGMDRNRHCISAARCGHRVAIGPFAALDLNVLPVNWACVAEDLVLGEWHPGFPRPPRPHFPWSKTCSNLGGVRRPRDLE